MLVAMSLAAALCVFNGAFPNAFLYPLLPHPVAYVPYTLGHVVTQMQLLFFSALAFVWLNLRGLYPPELPSTNLDSDWLYRRLGPVLIATGARAVQAPGAALTGLVKARLRAAFAAIARVHRPTGWLGEPWLVGTSTLWIAAVLATCLVLFYA